MELKLKRTAKRETYTIGKLYVDGKYFCDTLEDRDRGLLSNMDVAAIRKIKVKGRTAIPTGRYQITMDTVSPKFAKHSWAKPYGGKLPRLLNVPCYDGVLIHVGNTDADTEGCVLVGENKVVGRVINSTVTFHNLMAVLLKAKDRIFITIE